MSTTPTPSQTTPSGVIPTTVPPTTTPAPVVPFNDTQVTNINFTSTSPIAGTGGKEGSYENTSGEIFVENVVLDKPYPDPLTYIVYDSNGKKDEYGDPVNFVSGETSATINEDGTSIVQINRKISAVADPTNSSGNMRMVVQLRDPNFTTKTTGESVLNTVPAISQPTTTTTTTTTSISPTVPPSIPREGDRMTQETESAITDLFRETVSKPITKQTETIVSNLSELAVKIVETPTAEEKPKFNEEQLAFIARVNQGVANTAVLPGVVSPEPAIAPVREGEQL